MMWLRREMAKRDMERMPAPSPIENNPVGWSSIYPPPPGRVMENASPEFSPLAPSDFMTSEQKIGRFWNAATRQAKPAYTNADLEQLSKAGREAYDFASGFVNSSQPIRAYHGSPHTFDRFDLSKIGTGEGAQAYGHGLYFAGNEGVARSYKETLSGGGMTIAGKPFAPQNHTITEIVGASGGDAAKLKGALTEYVQRQQGNPYAGIDDAQRIIDSIDKRQFSFGNPGSMYEVNLRTTPERLLDWDKPLSQQPAAVREALSGALPAYDVKNWGGLPHAFANKTTIELPKGEVTGREAYILTRMGVNEENSRKAAAVASERLRDAGVPGIQYLDAGSRAAGEGSRNYVMFRDDIIDILKRYGLFGLGMVGGATAGPYGADNP